jgi:molecular chaperone HtpG
MAIAEKELLPLLRFASTHARTGEARRERFAGPITWRACQTGQGQDLLRGAARASRQARSHPAIEGLRARNVEVLLLGRRIDAWVMDHLPEFEGKKFKDASRGDLELGALESAIDKQEGRKRSSRRASRFSSASRTRWGNGIAETARQHSTQGFCGRIGCRRT